MSRKFLSKVAIVAASALASAGLVTAPAYAAEKAPTSVSVAPVTGTSYVVPATTPFHLGVIPSTTATYVDGTDTSSDLLVRVKGVEARHLVAEFKKDVGASYNIDATYDTASWSFLGTGTSFSDYTTGAVPVATSTDFVFTISNQLLSRVGQLKFTYSGQATDSAAVTVWHDRVSNLTVDDVETARASATIKWVKNSEVTGTMTFAPVYGGTSLKTKLGLSDAINVQQVVKAGDVRVTYQLNGTDIGTSGSGLFIDSNPKAAAYNTTDGLNVTPTITNGPLGVGVVSAVAQIKGDNGSFPSALTTNFASKAVSLSNIGVQSVADLALVRSTAAKDGDIRTGTKTVTMSAKIVSAVDNTKFVGNVPVTVEVAESKLAAGTTITADGKTLKTGGDAIEFAAVADANGLVTFSFTTDTGTKNDSVDVTVTVDGTSVTASKNVTWKDGTFSIYDLAGGSAGTGSSGVGVERSIVAKGTFDVSVKVVDQYGTVPADGTLVTLTRAAAATGDARPTASEAVFAYSAATADGVAKFTVVDNGTGLGRDELTIAAPATLAPTLKFFVNYLSNVTPAVLAANAGNDGVKDYNNAGEAYTSGTGDDVTAVAALVVETVALKALDARWEAVVAPAYKASNAYNNTSTTANELATLSGTVRDSAGNLIKGAPVTITGAGMAFVNADNFYAVDSITVHTDTNGAYSVDVRSSKNGLQTVSVVSGAVEKLVEFKFAAAAAVVARNMTLELPATAQPGRVVDAVVTVTDKDGKAAAGITVSFSSTGVGYLNVSSVTTDANGKAVAKLIVGSLETGSATVTATATLAGISTSKAATVVVSSSGTATADKKVNAGSFKGYVAIYARGYAGDRLSAKVGNDWVVVPSIVNNQEDGTLFRVVEFTGAGYTINIPIYINRVLVDTITVTTK